MGKLLWIWVHLLVYVAESWAQQGLANRLMAGEALYESEPGSVGLEAYPAALAMQKNTVVGFYGERRFMSDLAFFNIMFSGSLLDQPLMFSISREGTNALSQSRVSIAAGKKIGTGIQIGMNLGYTLYNARGYASRGNAEAGIGALLPLNDRFRIGIQLNRFNAAWGSKEFGFLARAGAGYRLSDLCSLTLEITKEAGKPVLTDAGIFYSFHSHIYTRLGFNPSLSLVNFSIGYRNHHLRAEMGQAMHLLLGSTWGMNIMYIFNDRE